MTNNSGDSEAAHAQGGAGALPSNPAGIKAEALQDAWQKVQGQLRQSLGESTYRSWLKPLAVLDYDGFCLRLAAPSRFVRDWNQTHYADKLFKSWQAQLPSLIRVEFCLRATQAQPPLRTAGKLTAPATAPAVPATISATPKAESAKPSITLGDLGRSNSLDKRYTFENFVVGVPNQLAFAAAQRVAESQDVTFNPLFFYGGVGLGKTHLMHAIAWRIRTLWPERRVVYIDAEHFMWQFVAALRTKRMHEFKETFRSADVLMIDDIQFIGGKEASQDEFFHTFNALADQQHQIIVSADRSPSDLDGIEERLRSRLGWGLVADLHPTTYELRLGILQQKMRGSLVEIPPKVLELLAYRITSNVRDLEGALTRLAAHATLMGQEVSLDMAQNVLQDLLRASDRQISIEEIQKRVAAHFNIKFSEMHSARRSRSVARPRQIAMYLAKQLTTRSLPEIGRKFGDRDHTTVLHAVRKVEELCKLDAAFDEDVKLLWRSLEG